jgi:phospholipase D1/2
LNGDAHRRRTGSNQDEERSNGQRTAQSEAEDEAQKGKYKEGGAERSDTHDSERNRKYTDEVGRYPAMLKGVKEEEAPGNRNDIILDPRVTHMHVSVSVQ